MKPGKVRHERPEMQNGEPTIQQRLGRADLKNPTSFIIHVLAVGLLYGMMTVVIIMPIVFAQDEIPEQNPKMLLVTIATGIVAVHVGLASPISMMMLNRRLRMEKPMEILTAAVVAATAAASLLTAGAYSVLSGGARRAVFVAANITLYAAVTTAGGLWAWRTADWGELLTEETKGQMR